KYSDIEKYSRRKKKEDPKVKEAHKYDNVPPKALDSIFYAKEGKNLLSTAGQGSGDGSSGTGAGKGQNGPHGDVYEAQTPNKETQGAPEVTGAPDVHVEVPVDRPQSPCACGGDDVTVQVSLGTKVEATQTVRQQQRPATLHSRCRVKVEVEVRRGVEASYDNREIIHKGSVHTARGSGTSQAVAKPAEIVKEETHSHMPNFESNKTMKKSVDVMALQRGTVLGAGRRGQLGCGPGSVGLRSKRIVALRSWTLNMTEIVAQKIARNPDFTEIPALMLEEELRVHPRPGRGPLLLGAFATARSGASRGLIVTPLRWKNGPAHMVSDLRRGLTTKTFSLTEVNILPDRGCQGYSPQLVLVPSVHMVRKSHTVHTIHSTQTVHANHTIHIIHTIPSTLKCGQESAGGHFCHICRVLPVCGPSSSCTYTQGTRSSKCHHSLEDSGHETTQEKQAGVLSRTAQAQGLASGSALSEMETQVRECNEYRLPELNRAIICERIANGVMRTAKSIDNRSHRDLPSTTRFLQVRGSEDHEGIKNPVKPLTDVVENRGCSRVQAAAQHVLLVCEAGSGGREGPRARRLVEAETTEARCLLQGCGAWVTELGNDDKTTEVWCECRALGLAEPVRPVCVCGEMMEAKSAFRGLQPTGHRAPCARSPQILSVLNSAPLCVWTKGRMSTIAFYTAFADYRQVYFSSPAAFIQLCFAKSSARASCHRRPLAPGIYGEYLNINVEYIKVCFLMYGEWTEIQSMVLDHIPQHKGRCIPLTNNQDEICTVVAIFFVTWDYFMAKYESQIVQFLPPGQRLLDSHWFWLKWVIWACLILGVIFWLVFDTTKLGQQQLVSFSGLIMYIILTFLFSNHPTKFLLGLLILRTEPGFMAFDWLGKQVQTFLEYTDSGPSFVFGEKYKDHFFALKVLPIVVFFSTVMFMLYYLGLIHLYGDAMGVLMPGQLGKWDSADSSGLDFTAIQQNSPQKGEHSAEPSQHQPAGQMYQQMQGIAISSKTRGRGMPFRILHVCAKQGEDKLRHLIEQINKENHPVTSEKNVKTIVFCSLILSNNSAKPSVFNLDQRTIHG
ncbi:hypothetical protein EI555_009339, partial [Monodon monoceros]